MKKANHTKATPATPGPGRNGSAPKSSTSLYLSEDIRTRLGRYILEKRGGKMHVRNQIILDALVEKLTREGY